MGFFSEDWAKRGFSFGEQKSGGSTQQMYRFRSFCEWCVHYTASCHVPQRILLAHGICLGGQIGLLKSSGITAPGKPDAHVLPIPSLPARHPAGSLDRYMIIGANEQQRSVATPPTGGTKIITGN